MHKTNSNTKQKQPTITQALVCLLGVAMIMISCTVLQDIINIRLAVLLCLIWTLINTFALSKDFYQLSQHCIQNLKQSSSILLIFILIGCVISSFIFSGAIPTLVYYGLDYITSNKFLPLGMILCSIMSLAIGTCWGTIGTMGVALMGMASILDVPLPIAAGMIVSGAYFGDKLSPLSDTTLLSAHSTGTNLYKHIKGMTYSLIPAYILSVALFGLVGAQGYVTHNTGPIELVETQKIIARHFHIGLNTLWPLAVLLALSLLKIRAHISMLCAIVSAVIVSILVQQVSLAQSLTALFTGPINNNVQDSVLLSAFNHGGIKNMLWGMSLTLLVLFLGGLLTTYQYIQVLFLNVVSRIKSATSLVATSLFSCVACNLLLGEAYLSIILVSKIFKPAYTSLGLDSCALSKAVEEGSTFSTPLIPWTTSGAFISATLGVDAFDYLFWSFFNWIAPCIFLLFVRANFAGIAMYKQPSYS